MVKPCHCICRWVLPLHHHPKLYIACYLVVKVGTLIWQPDTKRSNNKIILIPAGINDPIAVMYIPVCENRVQIESVSSVDSSSMSKGICWVLLMMCSYILCIQIEGMVVKCCSCVSLLLFPRCCNMQKSSAEMFIM